MLPVAIPWCTVAWSALTAPFCGVRQSEETRPARCASLLNLQHGCLVVVLAELLEGESLALVWSGKAGRSALGQTLLAPQHMPCCWLDTPS